MLRGRGIPLLENEEVCWFLGFLVSNFQRINDAKFQWSRITRNPFHVFWNILIPYPRFSRIIRRTVGIVRCPSFHTFFRFEDFPKFWDLQKKIDSTNGISWILWSVLGPPEINHIGFGAQGHVRKFRNHRNKQFEGPHITKSESCKFKLKQNNTMELYSISFPSRAQRGPIWSKIPPNRNQKWSKNDPGYPPDRDA